MKKLLLISYLILTFFTPVVALADTGSTAYCQQLYGSNYAWNGSNCVLSGSNTSTAVSCSAAGADPATCIPSGSTAATPVTTPASTQTVTTATNTTCPNGGTQNANGSCNLGYTPLEPIPGLVNVSSLVAPGSLPQIINAIFKILITGGALIAVASLVFGGLQYMTSMSPSLKNAGIKRAQAAIFGILLISATWLILNTVNPQLLNFNLNPCQPGSTTCTATSGGSGFSPSSGLTNTVTDNSPISGVPVDQENCTAINAAQSASGLLLNDGAFIYGLKSTVKIALPTSWGGMTAAQQTQADHDYLAACAQAKLL